LVKARTQLINATRGLLRSSGVRIRSGGAESFVDRVREKVQGIEHVEDLLHSIEALTTRLRRADKALEQIAKDDPTCPRLMSMPGVGPVTATRFVAALDEIGRFESAHKVEAYLGLTPGEYASSQTRHRLSITKAGPAAVRRALLQSVWSIRRCRPSDPMVHWALEVEKRRGKHVASVALARKMVGVLYAMWRDGTLYSPREAASRATASREGDRV
jgi:transposase